MGMSQVDFPADSEVSSTTSLAEEVDVTGILLPEAWTEAVVGFEAGFADGTWATIRDERGSQLILEVQPPRRQGLGNFLPVHFPVAQGALLRLTSGAMEGQVSQLEDVTVTIFWRKA